MRARYAVLSLMLCAGCAGVRQAVPVGVRAGWQVYKLYKAETKEPGHETEWPVLPVREKRYLDGFSDHTDREE